MNQADDSDVAVERRKRFEEKAPKHRKMLVGFVVRRTHDPELAEEIAQQTLLNYLTIREAENWQRDIKNEAGYLIKIARNLMNDGWRLQSKTKSVSIDEQLDQLLKVSGKLTGNFDAEQQVYLEELRHTIPLKTLLGGLDERQKRLLYLRVVDELSYQQIAEEVKGNPHLVRYELQRIFATVKARVKKIFGKKSLFKSE